MDPIHIIAQCHCNYDSLKSISISKTTNSDFFFYQESHIISKTINALTLALLLLLFFSNRNNLNY